MLVDDLPTGSVLIFVFNLFTSFFFQFIGFVITYFLSTTHAARYGSRAGLGLTFIQYGAYWRAAQIVASPSREEQQELAFWNATLSGTSPNSTTLLDSMVNQNGTGTGEVYYDDAGFGGKDWLALFFMTFGEPLSLLVAQGAVQPLGDRRPRSQPNHLLKPFPCFAPVSISQTHRLGIIVHFCRRFLESEKVGDVDQGVFPPSSACGSWRCCSGHSS